MKLGIFGGSFDPIHIGHLNLAENVCSQLGYEKLIFFPAFISPFKQTQKACLSKYRLEMLFLATKKNPKFAVDGFELKRNEVSYTIDTVRYCYENYKFTGKLGLVIGNDLLQNFYEWKDAERLLELCDLIVGDRKVESVRATKLAELDYCHKVQKFQSPKHIIIENTILQISSSYIRSAILQNKSWRYLVPECVYEYINSKNLYKKD